MAADVLSSGAVLAADAAGTANHYVLDIAAASPC
jgi:hypothetical protein